MDQPRLRDPACLLPPEIFKHIGIYLAQVPTCPRVKTFQFYRYLEVSKIWRAVLEDVFFSLPLLFCVTGDQRCSKWKCHWCSPNPERKRENNDADVCHYSFYKKLMQKLDEAPTLLDNVTQIYFEFPEDLPRDTVRRESMALNKLIKKMPRLRSIQIAAPEKYGNMRNRRFFDWLEKLNFQAISSNITSLAIPIGIIEDYIPSSVSCPNVRNLSLSGGPAQQDHYHPNFLETLTTWVGTMLSVQCLRFAHSLQLKGYPSSVTEIHFTCRMWHGRSVDEVLGFYAPIVALPNLEVLSLCPAPISGDMPRTKVAPPPISCRKLKTLVFGEDKTIDTIGKFIMIKLLEECQSLQTFAYFGTTLDSRFVLSPRVTTVQHCPAPFGESLLEQFDLVFLRPRQDPPNGKNAIRSVDALCAMLASSPSLRLVHLDADNFVTHIAGDRFLRSLLSKCSKLDRIKFSGRSETLYKKLGLSDPFKNFITEEDNNCEIDVRAYRRYLGGNGSIYRFRFPSLLTCCFRNAPD
jgi:hypothetical protein